MEVEGFCSAYTRRNQQYPPRILVSRIQLKFFGGTGIERGSQVGCQGRLDLHPSLESVPHYIISVASLELIIHMKVHETGSQER